MQSHLRAPRPTPELRVDALGEAAFACRIAGAITLAHQRRIWAFDRAVCGAIDGAQTIVGMNNLTVLFDVFAHPPDALRARLEELWSGCGEDMKDGRLVEIPVVYGGATGPDLAEVARHAGLSPHEVVQLHSERLYTVFFVGFQPGFAYLGELDPRLATPRRADPRIRVPAGSVAIGGNQTGVFPLHTPGGWQLIGRTQLQLFDVAQQPPTLLCSADQVRFVVEDILPC